MSSPASRSEPTGGAPPGPAAAGLGDTRLRLLDQLKRGGESGLAELAAGLGLARETLRQHLRGLAALGLIERRTERRAGPGRPRTLFRLSPRAQQLYPRREGEILRELVEHLAESGRESLLEELFERRTRRQRDAGHARLAGRTGLDRLRAVAEILSEQGFLAEIGEDEGGRHRLRLCHCPWSDLVAVSKVPCRFELDLIEELLGETLRRELFMPAGDATCTYSRSSPAPAQGLVTLPTT